MTTAEIIAIGTELLLGEIQDTNTRFLARQLRDEGVDIYRATLVGDNPERIAQAIREAGGRSQVILTTGGLGPTVDDPTREAVALAAGAPVEFREELWAEICARYQRLGRQPSENNRRQAYLPAGARAISNPVGTAPGFICALEGGAVVISLPGVPREMEYLYHNAVLPYLKERYHLHGLILARVLHSAGLPESTIDEQIGEFERLANPTVGLAAHSGQIDIRITAKAETRQEAEGMIAGLEAEIRARLGEAIYGADAETLEGAVGGLLAGLGWRLAVYEPCAAAGAAERLRAAGIPLVDLQAQEQAAALAEIRQSGAAGLMVCLLDEAETQRLAFHFISPLGERQAERKFLNAPGSMGAWAPVLALDFLRRALLDAKQGNLDGRV